MKKNLFSKRLYNNNIAIIEIKKTIFFLKNTC